MKKTYQQPAIAEMGMDENKPIAASTITINNEAQNDVSGDVKAGGAWDIWSDETAE